MRDGLFRRNVHVARAYRCLLLTSGPTTSVALGIRWSARSRSRRYAGAGLSL